jgi:hypothetical protein
LTTQADPDEAFDRALQRHAMTLLAEAREPARAVFRDLSASARLLRESHRAPLMDPDLFEPGSGASRTSD